MLLALDTSLGAVSVALAIRTAGGDASIAHRFEARANGHAERVFELLAEVLAEAGTRLADVTRVAVTLGPGTFTGVRTGIAFARAIALSAGAEVVGVTSLELAARGARRALAGSPDDAPASPPDVALVVAVDARRDQLYVQSFTQQGLASLSAPALLSLEAAAAALPAGPIIAVGSGAVSLAEAARQRGITVRPALPSLEPDALDLLQVAPALPPLVAPRPLYIRPPDAKPPTNSGLARRS